MKTKKPVAKKRAVPKAKVKARPLHKRILLHPFSVMVLLCAGVIIAGTTFHGFATSYDVAAQVNAAPPSGPATITSPVDQIHTTESTIDVNGTCPMATYVVVFRGGQAAGTAACAGTTFQVRLNLATGPNQLQAKVYNTTNQEGPASNAITVFRDPIPVTPTTPLTAPTTLQIQTVEKSDYIPDGGPSRASPNPTVSGFAPPWSDITITFHSDIQTCKTQADGSGWWTCTLANALPAGTHHVDIEAWTLDGQRLTYPTFEIVVLPQLPSLIPQRLSLPFIEIDYRYQTHYPGQAFNWNVGLQGGTPPFKVTVNWGDGSESTYTRADGSVFTITHAFPQKQTYTVFVKSVDRNGTQAIMQLFAIVKGQDGVAATSKPGPLIGTLAALQRYLWIVWPAYIAVLLMVLSYWLGEKEMYLHFMGHTLAHHGPRGGGSKRRRL